MVRVRAATLPAAVLAMVVGWAARPAAAQETPTFALTGQIVDAVNERPVIAAVIKVPELRRFVFSDVNGRFHFPDFPEGTWEIVVEQLGYHTLDGSVTVSEGNGLSLRLNPDPIALEGLRVRTRSEQLLERRRRLTPYRVTRISPEIIANAINPDPTAIFRRKANSLIVPCSSDPDESMTPGLCRRARETEEDLGDAGRPPPPRRDGRTPDLPPRPHPLDGLGRDGGSPPGVYQGLHTAAG